jgi:hypothetical protein
MSPELRIRLLNILARLDKSQSLADEILSDPVYPDVAALAEELREMLVEMQARVAGHLDDDK